MCKIMNYLLQIFVTITVLLKDEVNAITIFKPCSASDPKLNECLKITAQQLIPLISKGVSDLNLDPIEPYRLSDISNPNAATLRFLFSNTTVYGKNTTKINSIEINLKEQIINADFTSDERTVSICKVNGTLLIIQIQGEGRCITDIIKANYKMKIKYDIVQGKDGKNHWKIKSHESTLNPGRMKYQFENLFGGNKILSDAVHRFANEYWREILDEFGYHILRKITNKAAKQIDKIFSVIPAEDIILP